MNKIMGGKLYDTEKALLVAKACSRAECGRNSLLYKTAKGNFFLHLTVWQGERDSLERLTRDEAKQCYENFSEHSVEYKEAFDEELEDA